MSDQTATPPPTQMATEPALQIGDLFGDKAMIRTYVVAAASLLAFWGGRSIPDDQIGNIVELLSGLGLIVTAAVAQWEARKRAREQALVTRQNVYSPATTQTLIDQAATSGTAEQVTVAADRPPVDDVEAVLQGRG